MTVQHMMPSGAVLVLGGGVAGIQSALDLAESGYKVYLVEKSPSIGGVMAQLDKTFPTNDCAMCILGPKLVECSRHLNIELLTYSELVGLEGSAGDFTARVKKKPRYVDESKCTGCGRCAEICPVQAWDEFDEGLGKRKAIYRPFPQASPNVFTIEKEKEETDCGPDCTGCPDCAVCLECGACARVCEADAIDYEQKPQHLELEVGALVLSPGFDEFEPEDLYRYGYKRFDDVVTSIEFERILSASGPFGGELICPSDGQHPESIAWIQCVGSRDEQLGCSYCSSVCCTYAIKEAQIAIEHSEDELDTSIYYIDMRTFGKGFEEYYQRSKDEFGIEFIPSEISEVEQTADGRLQVEYVDSSGRPAHREHDMVVLSVGLRPPSDADSIYEIAGLHKNRHGFTGTRPFAPVSTSVEGIYVCGGFQSPQDIPQTVTQASAAAGRASALLSGSRGQLTREKEYPQEKPVESDPPRVGVFVCHCGINIGGVVDVPEVKEFAADLPHVVCSEELLYACSQDAQDYIKEKIEEHDLNRVVVSSCTPRTHEALFQETIREAGLNPYLFTMANIRDQCSWVHSEEPEAATEKSKALTQAAVAKSLLQTPLPEVTISSKDAALVIGGGVSGMVIAENLAEQGFPVMLVEKEEQLGGNALHLQSTLDGQDVPSYLKQLKKDVHKNPHIDVHLGTEVVEASGYVGNYESVLQDADGQKQVVEHAVAVIATGAGQYSPSEGEYGFGKSQKVLTCRQIEEALGGDDQMLRDADQIALIHCVGSRDDERTYCSRVCCSQSVKIALSLKEKYPGTDVNLLYRDIRTYGFGEEYYRKARQEGVNFIRFDDDCEPEVRCNPTGPEVTVYDEILGENVTIKPDLLGLACGVVPMEDALQLAQLYKVPLNEDGFFLEAHVKLRPVDFATDGVFLAGLAHGPKSLEESIAQAEAAAARAAVLLTQDELAVGGWTAEVDEQRCSGCGACERVCPYSAVEVDESEGKASVQAVLCKGCGACTVACRAGAVDARGFTSQQILKEVEAACLQIKS